MTEIEESCLTLQKADLDLDSKNTDSDDGETEEPSHHTRRPMNAFLIFCKKHRGVVRNKYPNLENRSITKILGEWWKNLEKDDKECYTNLAKQYKDAFFSANPGFKWYKLPAPPLRTFTTRPSNSSSSNSYNEQDDNHSSCNEICDIKPEQTNNNHIIKSNYDFQPSTSKILRDEKKSIFTPGKLADEAHMGGLNSLFVSEPSPDDCHNNNSEIIKVNNEKSTNMDNSFSTVNSHLSTLKKREILENDENEDVINKHDSNNHLSASEAKLQKLQDELSETSRVFQSYDDPSENKSTYSNFDDSDSFNDDHHCNHVDHLKFHNHYENDDTKSLKHQSENSCGKFCRSKQPYCYENGNEKMNNKRSHKFDKSHCKANGRSCKGKRYQEFMTSGGLIVNKRPKKDHMDHKYSYKQDTYHSINDLNNSTNRWEIYEQQFEKHRLRNMENTKRPSLTPEKKNNHKSAYDNRSELDDTGQSKDLDNIGNKMFKESDFNLDAKIKALPSLSLEKFQQKKKENKKRKRINCKQKNVKRKIPRYDAMNHIDNSRINPVHNFDKSPFISNKSHILQNEERLRMAEERRTAITGSKKRKPRKISITRLEINSSSKLNQNNELSLDAINHCTKNDEIATKATSILIIPDQNSQNSIDVSALNTLAEVAANMKK